MNPPSAWAVARRDRPEVAEQTWHHGMAAGPAGRYGPFTTPFWGIWNFGKNQSAAKSLLTALSQADAIESMVKASAGYDIPAFANLTTLKMGQKKGRPRARSITTPTRSTTRSCRSRPRPRSADRRSDLSAWASTQMVVATPSRASRWTRCWALRRRARGLHASLSSRGAGCCSRALRDNRGRDRLSKSLPGVLML